MSGPGGRNVVFMLNDEDIVEEQDGSQRLTFLGWLERASGGKKPPDVIAKI